MRILAISDIHGCYETFLHLLKKIHFNYQTDQLILLGDYLDRGPNSKETVECVKQLVEKYGVIALGGNHEDLFLSWLEDETKEEDDVYLPQGGLQTIHSYTSNLLPSSSYETKKQYIKEHYSEHIKFLQNLPDYYETEEFLFVHAGINPVLMDWKNSEKKFFRWAREHFWHFSNETGKTIVFGHTSTHLFHERVPHCFDPYTFPCNTRIAIDGGCVFGGQLNAIEITENGIKDYHVKK